MVIDNDLGSPFNNILAHHGVEGQKWGQQNGPPYPLDPNKDYSKRELKAYKKQLRKEYRKEVKRRKKFIKKYKKEEEERLKLEEAKKKAIQSGSVSEIEKYRDKMTDEELEEAMKRVKTIQDLERVKVNDIRISNEKVREELNKITMDNDMKKQELIKQFGPGKGEAILDKASRISDKIGNIAQNAQKVTGLLKGQVELDEKKYKFNKRKKEDEAKEKEDKKNKFIEKVINSGDENEINKHINEMSNEQLKSAMDRLDMLNPEKERIERAITSGNRSEVEKYARSMSTAQYEDAMKKVKMYDKEADAHNRSVIEGLLNKEIGDGKNISHLKLASMSAEDLDYTLKRLELLRKIQTP